MSNIKNVGFVSTRIAGTDGVSLEIGKWETVLERMGYRCHYVCGKCDRSEERTYIIDLADFGHPDIQSIDANVFGHHVRNRELSHRIDTLAKKIKDQLYDAVKAFEIDLLIVENAVTIPMNIPLGVALAQFVIETGISCIAHHHDFAWERRRYLVNAADDYLKAAFPPALPEIRHVVINSLAGQEFSRRTGLSCRLIPNVMDFANPPADPDEYAADFRSAIGVAEDDILIVQPTRVLQRKNIEHTIELVHRLNDPRCRLLITHDHPDHARPYAQRILEYAEILSVPLIQPGELIAGRRGRTAEGKKRYAIWDVYPHADLITYPSSVEGFGNAFLEAMYFRKCIFCNRYSNFQTDIEPYGFRAIVMDGFLTADVVDDVREALSDETHRVEIEEHNYRLGERYFSYDRLEKELHAILEAPGDGPPAPAAL